MAYSPDGKLLAVATGDGETSAAGAIAILDAETLRQRTVLTGHTRAIETIAFAPDGKTLASSSGDATVRLWDPASARELAVLRSDVPVAGLAFAPDGRTLAGGLQDGSIALWDITSQRQTATYRGHAGIVSCVSFAPEGRTLASAGKDGAVKLWEPPRPAVTARVTLPGPPGGAAFVIYAPDGQMLATGGTDKRLRLTPTASAGPSRVPWCPAISSCARPSRRTARRWSVAAKRARSRSGTWRRARSGRR